MRKKIYLLEAALLLLLVACSVKLGNEEALERVARLKYVRPDSALAILDSMKADGQRFSRHDEMLWQLQRMDVENKLDTLFHTTADAQRLADYFDRHGSANEQMLAHYLLGRAYADTHEAPMALGCYMDAIEKADTTREDCDFKLLGRVCIQAGEVLDLKRQIPERLSFVHKAIDYSDRSGDSLTVVYLYGMIGEAYERLNKADSAILMFEHMADRYRQLGRKDLAAGWLGYCARLHIEKREFAKAAEHMRIYERESGFFHENGEIEAGREPYYGMKGRYYFNVGKLDSAEYFYRLELKRGLDFNNQSIGSRGLSKVFTEKGMPDSAAKYSMYCLQMSDSLYERNVTDKLKRVKDLFDYSRSQRIASEAMEKAHARLLWLLLFGGISGMVIASLLFLYRSKVKEARARYERLLLMEKENSLLRGDRSKAANPEQVVAGMDYFQTTNIWRRMQEMQVSTAAFPMKLTDEDWEELKREIETAWPLFMDKLRSLYPNLNKRQMQVCLLTKIGLKPKLVAELVDLSEQGVGSLKRRLYEKAFNEKGGTKDFDRSILLI